MGFLKSFFGGKTESPEEKKKEEESKEFDVLKYDGVRTLRSGQYVYAVQCFQHALELQEDLEVRDYLSQALIHNNEILPAYEQLQKLNEAQPENVDILIRMADVCYMMEDYTVMADACEKAMLIDKDNPQVLFFYARACIGQGDCVNAVAMLTKAISLKKNNGEAYLLRGETLLDMGDLNGADEDADFLLSKAEGNEDVLLLKARVGEAKGEHEQAIDYYNKVIESNPFSMVALKERGAIKMNVGDKDGAEADMRTLMELNPDKVNEVNGEFCAEGTENIQQKVEQAYKQSNPFGLWE